MVELYANADGYVLASPVYDVCITSLINFLGKNCGDEYRELMGDPCFEMLESQLLIEQIETVEKLYVGGVENMTEEMFKGKLRAAFHAGKTLVERIKT